MKTFQPSDKKIKRISKACTYLRCHLYPCLVFVCIIFICCFQRHAISSGTFSLAAFCSIDERSALSLSSIVKHSFLNLSPVFLPCFCINLVAPFLFKLKDNFLLRQISFVTFGFNADASFLALPLDVLNFK